MSSSYFPSEYYKDTPDRAVTLLADHLMRGELSLVLGAGVSIQIGLPTWYNLVHGCLLLAGFNEDASRLSDNADELKRSMDKVETHYKDNSKYCQAVSQCLYKEADYAIDIIAVRLRCEENPCIKHP